MQIWLSLALVVLTGHEPSVLQQVHCSFFKLQLCFFWVVSRCLFMAVYFPCAYPFGKRGIASSPLVLGADTLMLLVHLSPKTKPCLTVISHPVCCYHQGKGCAISAGASKPKFHEGAEADRVKGFTSDSEALTNQAVPDFRKTGSRLPWAPSLSSKQHFDKIQQQKSFPSW